MTSTAFNADTAYAVWRACCEGYETCRDGPADHSYAAGDAWGCIGRSADEYVSAVRDMLAHGRRAGVPNH
jgi:autotransporter family porin